MKYTLFFIYAIFLFCSCSEQEVVPEIAKPELIYFYGFIGEKNYAFIDMKANNYTLKIDDPEAISWKYIEKSDAVEINTSKGGSFSIDVLDKDGNVKIVISIYAFYLRSKHIEEISNHPTERIEIIVNVENNDIKKIIEDELREDLQQKDNTLYTFDAETKIFTINNPRTGEKYQGSYDWNIDSLTLKYNDMTEKYGFKIATGRHHYLLWADKTEEYRLRYPDAGITSVRVKKIWYDYDAVKPDFGLVI